MLGRGDDVINISGHCLNSGELESAINSYNLACESAVVGYYHEIKGEGICAFIILKEDININDSLKYEILEHVKIKIGSIAKPTKIFFVDSLPKTRSGKIMRRILRNILNKKEDEFGDLSTLANPDCINSLIQLINEDK
jgi:acetyl-CoA synthetase